MSFPECKTLEEHRQYQYEIVRLQLWFLHHWLAEHPDETFKYVLRNRVDIYRKTDVNNGNINPVTLHWEYPEWQNMEKEAERLYNIYINDAAAFEEAAFEVFKPSLDARCERDANDNSEASRYQCGFLRHNLELTQGVPAPRLGFHIANFCTPASFFDYPDYMKGCFLMLLDRAEYIFHATEIGTGTWLNSVPKWLEWFPQEWKDNMGEPRTDIQWHYGFWGQFITARKTFNAKYGQILRTTGKFPFYPRASFCRISTMREFLANR